MNKPDENEGKAMINDFEDFCIWMYSVISDVYATVKAQDHRPGPQPVCSDAELITMAVIGECRGWDTETVLLSMWREYQHLFPHIPERTRFNRRRRALAQVINTIRRIILRLLDVAADMQCAIDSLPVPVVNFHLSKQASREWRAAAAAYGRVASKKQTIYGYTLHLLITLGGVILDFELAPANAEDITIGAELLFDHTDLTVVGDKGYISAPIAQELADHNRVHLLTQTRKNQKRQTPPHIRQLHNRVRPIVETVNGQLAEHLNIEHNYAHTFDGLCARLYSKLAAHTLCIYLNRLTGYADFLQIKHLAFPI